jgi:hypothetical protein
VSLRKKTWLRSKGKNLTIYSAMKDRMEKKKWINVPKINEIPQLDLSD